MRRKKYRECITKVYSNFWLLYNDKNIIIIVISKKWELF